MYIYEVRAKSSGRKGSDFQISRREIEFSVNLGYEVSSNGPAFSDGPKISGPSDYFYVCLGGDYNKFSSLLNA